jgi:signal transduction histidine kinase
MKFYYLVLLFFSFKLGGQHIAPQWYGMEEGLPQNSVKDIAKDKYGFIWLSTDGGIVRFDGVNFILYNNFKISSSSFNDFLVYGKDEMTCFNNSEQECILVADRTAKIIPVEKVSKTYSFVQDIHYKRFYKNTLITKFFPDVNNYYIKTNSGTYFFDNHKIEYETAGVAKKTIYNQNFKHYYLKNAFEQNGIVYIADPRKRRTMILQNGLIKYDETPSLYNDPQSRIYWHQGTKQVFVINKSNIYFSKIINGKPTLTFLIQYKNIENEFLYCMFFDEEYNKIYFGTTVKGLNIINLSNFYIPKKNIPFAGEFVYESLPYTLNSVITREGLEYSNKTVKRIFRSNIKYDKRFALYDDSQNLLYLDLTLNRRHRDSQFKKKDSISFPKRRIEGIYKDGSLYIASMSDYQSNYYLNVYHNDQFRDPKITFKFKENISFVKAYRRDILYVGTSNGIYLVSLSKSKIISHIALGLSIKEIQCTKDGNFWFTTYNKGFYLLKNNKAIKMPDDRERYLLNAHHILEDEEGFFWISSNNGLFKVKKKMLLDYANNKSRVLYYRYTKENGLLNNEFNGSSNPSGNILANGEYVFPSMEGFVFFKPQEIQSHYPKKDQLFIERAQVGKGTILFKDTLRLKSDYSNVDIFIDIPYYNNIDNIYLEAKIDDYEHEGWREIKTDKKYLLDNLSPRTYSLTIRFLMSENGSFAYKKIFIEVVPYFYQTKLFKILMVMLFATAIILIIQFRTNFLKIKNQKLKINLHNRNQELYKTNNTLEVTKTKLKNQSEYQQKIMESISHDIMTPVKFISYLSQKLSNTEDPEIQKKYYDGIYKSSDQLFKFILSLKEYNDLYKEDLTFDVDEHSIYDIIEDKKLLFKEIASDKNSIILNLSDPQLKLRVNKNIIAAILHNIIDNAVKNTIDGEIIIKTTIKSNNVEIEISDTGTGMSKSQIQYYSEISESMEKEGLIFKKYGLGLHMVIQLSKKIGAGISFHENMPKGTIVKVFYKKNYE